MITRNAATGPRKASARSTQTTWSKVRENRERLSYHPRPKQLGTDVCSYCVSSVCRKSCGTCTGPGFTIGSCEPNPCLNGGTCQEEGNYDYRCLCRDGYTGRRCENEETQRIRFKMRRDDGYGGKWLRARYSPGGRLTYDITAGERWYTWWIRKGDQLIAENTNRCLTRVPCGGTAVHCQFVGLVVRC